MKELRFRPLRFVKKTGQIVVASYSQWRNVMTADYSKFKLNISNEHHLMNRSDLVYNHKGEQIFFFTYNPSNVPIFQWHRMLNLKNIMRENDNYGIVWDVDGHINYNMKGCDCSGVPCFSHYTTNNIATHYYKQIEELEPLTVGMVSDWYGWFLWQLNNCTLHL